MHNFYPEGHPNLESALGKCFYLIRKELGSQGEIEWKIDQKGFYTDTTPLSGDSSDLMSLARKFFYRRIKQIVFTQRATLDEFKKFLSILRLEPEEFHTRGGVEAVLAEEGIDGILLNEMRYEDLLRLKKELEEKEKEREEKRLKEEEEKKADGAGAEEERPETEEEALKEEGFHELLAKLTIERDLLRYNDLTVRVVDMAEALAFNKRYGEIFHALSLFLKHSSPASDLTVELRSIALKRIDSLLKNINTIKYLTYRAGIKDVQNRAEIQRLLVRAGDPAIEELLDALIEAPEASIRRNLFNTVILFNKKLLPSIEKRLANGQWYAIRQMIAILGEIGDPDTQRMLEAAYGHEDIRVKKEVLKSLARFQTSRSTAFLLESLAEEDPRLKTQAIISLGMRRDPAAIDQLGEIALKWEPFSDNQDIQREAIKALGIIGDQKASQYLAKILLRKKWFGKKMNEELRVLAANSLGMISGTEAYDAIEKACGSSTGNLYNVCKRILEGREQKV